MTNKPINKYLEGNKGTLTKSTILHNHNNLNYDLFIKKGVGLLDIVNKYDLITRVKMPFNHQVYTIKTGLYILNNFEFLFPKDVPLRILCNTKAHNFFIDTIDAEKGINKGMIQLVYHEMLSDAKYDNSFFILPLSAYIINNGFVELASKLNIRRVDLVYGKKNNKTKAYD